MFAARLTANDQAGSSDGGTIVLDSALSSFTSNGALQAKNGSTLTSNVNVTGTGTLTALDNSAVNLAAGSSLNQQGGTSQVDGAVTLNGTFTVSSGTLKGAGTIIGIVVNSGGTVAPGDSPGTLTVNGSYSQGANGTLAIEFTNTAHDLLTVTGPAVTGGIVNFSFLDTSVATGIVGETFDFLTSAGVGTNLPSGLFFANETPDTTGQSNGFVTEAGPGGVYRIARDPSNANALQVVVLAVVPAPEPSQFAALGIGLLGLGALVLKARRRQWAD